MTLPLFKNLSLRQQMVLATMLVAQLFVVIVLTIVTWNHVNARRDALVSHTQSLAHTVGQYSVSDFDFADRDAAQQTLTKLQDDPDLVEVQLIDTSGGLFASMRGAKWSGFDSSRGESYSEFIGDHLVVVTSVRVREKLFGYVRFFVSQQSLRQQIRRDIGVAIGVGIVLAGLAFLIASRIQSWVVGPIHSLANLAGRISQERNFSLRAATEGPTEVRKLQDAFNTMFDAIEHHQAERDRAVEALKQHQERLEQTIAERTQELQQQATVIRQSNHELELANKELEAFSYSVSHDLRAPLRAVDGFSQALLEDYDEQLDVVAKDHLQRVRRAAQTMARLIDDLLNLSRVLRAEMRREQVDLGAVAREIVDQLRVGDSSRSAEFVLGAGMIVFCDPGLVRALLENLIGNAWKFSGKVAQPRIELNMLERNGERAFVVRDNGAGFDSRYINKLFNPFQRLHRSDEFPGSGIGLATVARIVRRHGGRVWAEGEVGKGASFYFTLEPKKPN